MPKIGAYTTLASATINRVFDEVDLRPASPDEIGDVLAVLNDAARRLRDRAIRQWPAAFEPEWIRSDILSGDTWIGKRAGRPVVTIMLGWTDPLWPDDELGGYIHRMARTGDAAGVGDQLLRWADDRVRERRRRFLRLDCVASNSALRGFYETRGFAHRGDAVVGGPPGSRSGEGEKTTVSLYERELA